MHCESQVAKFATADASIQPQTSRYHSLQCHMRVQVTYDLQAHTHFFHHPCSMFFILQQTVLRKEKLDETRLASLFGTMPSDAKMSLLSRAVGAELSAAPFVKRRTSAALGAKHSWPEESKATSYLITAWSAMFLPRLRWARSFVPVVDFSLAFALVLFCTYQLREGTWSGLYKSVPFLRSMLFCRFGRRLASFPSLSCVAQLFCSHNLDCWDLVLCFWPEKSSKGWHLTKSLYSEHKMHLFFLFSYSHYSLLLISNICPFSLFFLWPRTRETSVSSNFTSFSHLPCNLAPCTSLQRNSIATRVNMCHHDTARTQSNKMLVSGMVSSTAGSSGCENLFVSEIRTHKGTTKHKGTQFGTSQKCHFYFGNASI